MISSIVVVAFLTSLRGIDSDATSTVENEGDFEGKVGGSKDGGTMDYSERSSKMKPESKTKAQRRFQSAKALVKKLNDTLRENYGQPWSDTEAHALRQDLQTMIEFLQQYATSGRSEVASRSSGPSVIIKSPITTYEADWLQQSKMVKTSKDLEARLTTESVRMLGEVVGDEASDWVLEHDNRTCFGGKQLTTSLVGSDGGARDAAKCGSLAALDDGCNPMYVHVRTEPPFKDCFCATVDNKCAIQQFNSEFAVFRKRTTPSPTDATPTRAQSKALRCPELQWTQLGVDWLVEEEVHEEMGSPADGDSITNAAMQIVEQNYGAGGAGHLAHSGFLVCAEAPADFRGTWREGHMSKYKYMISQEGSAVTLTRMDGATFIGTVKGRNLIVPAFKVVGVLLDNVIHFDDGVKWFLLAQTCVSNCSDCSCGGGSPSGCCSWGCNVGYVFTGYGRGICEAACSSGAPSGYCPSGQVCNQGVCEARSSYNCSGSSQSVGTTYDFNSPFSLNMDVVTASSQSGDGGIFEGRSDGNTLVELYWNGHAICLQLGQVSCSSNWDACIVQSDCVPASKGQRYSIKVEWDGSIASWRVNNLVRGSWSTTEGFGTDIPAVCYTASGGIHGWSGSITGLVLQACSAGMTPKGGESTCSPCDAGRFLHENSSSCTDCGSGTIPNNDQSGCKQCEAGKYSRGGDPVCTSCEAGRVSTVGAAECVQCVGGKIPNASSNDDCIQCQVGKQSNSGDISCTPCHADEVAKAGSSQCTQCVGGKIPDTRQETCTGCAAGRFSTSGSLICKACEAGKYSSQSAHICGTCESGEVPNDPQSACRTCDAGTKSSKGDSVCTVCSRGTYNDAAMQSTCLACPVGTFSKSVGTTACAGCAPGSYAGLEGRTACRHCPPGQFNTAPMMLRCDSCGLGTFSSTPGSIGCEPCLPGRYNGMHGLNYSCRECPKGKHTSEPMQATCEPCPLGRFTAEVGTSRCQRCSDARMTTMSKVLADDGQQHWAYRDGAEDESWCGCDKQTRMTDAGNCVDCEEGVDCVGMGEFVVKRGYAAEMLDNGGLSIFKCHGLVVCCMGGTPGKTCAEGREGVSCARCKRLRTPSPDGTCAKCGKRDTFPLVLACLGAFLLLMLMYCLVVTTNKAKRSTWLLLSGMSCSIMITGVQQLNIIRMFSIHWPAPLIHVLNILGIIAFDVELIRMHCVASTSSLGIFSGKLCMIGVGFFGLILIHAGFVQVFHRGRFREHSPSLVCGLGLLVMVLYTSLTGMVLEPLQCLSNPNGKKTVSGYQAVVCWQTEEHVLMVSVGVIALIVPVLFLVHCTVVVNRFPHQMMQGDTRFLRMYMFLFFRYRTEMYWYAPLHIFRSLLLSITPIIPNPVGQLITMQILTMVHLVTTVYLAPWRLQLANLLESIVMALILLVLSVASLLVEETPIFEIVCLVIAVICAIAFAVILMISYAFLVHISNRRKKTFDYFLCHHKAGARCFVRLLRMHLRDVNCTAFLDSDNLSNLDRLFDYVACDTNNLVVVCSKDILMRPWCVGEIVTGMLHRVTTVQVDFEEFEAPSDEFIQHYDAHVGDLSVLSSFGIDLSMIQEGLRWLLSVPAFELPSHATKTTMDSLVVKMSKTCVKGRTSERRVTFREDPFPKDAQVVILIDHSNFETNACALVLVKLLIPHVMSQPELIPHALPQDVVLPKAAEVLIILCTSGIFQKPYFLRALRIAAGRPRGCFHIPILAESNFKFPTRPILEDNRAIVAAVCDDEEAMFSLILDVFKSIALDFQPERTEDMLRTQASEVAKRLTSHYGSANARSLLPHVQAKVRASRLSRTFSGADSAHSVGCSVSGSSSLKSITAASKVSL